MLKLFLEAFVIILIYSTYCHRSFRPSVCPSVCPNFRIYELYKYVPPIVIIQSFRLSLCLSFYMLFTTSSRIFISAQNIYVRLLNPFLYNNNCTKHYFFHRIVNNSFYQIFFFTKLLNLILGAFVII